MSNVYIKQPLKGKIHVGIINSGTKDFTEFEEYQECLDTSNKILDIEEENKDESVERKS